jgi:hypothetical protein
MHTQDRDDTVAVRSPAAEHVVICMLHNVTVKLVCKRGLGCYNAVPDLLAKEKVVEEQGAVSKGGKREQRCLHVLKFAVQSQHINWIS